MSDDFTSKLRLPVIQGGDATADNKIGALSGEAIRRTYEAAAVNLEAMSEEVRQRIAETAAAIRHRGKECQEEVERMHALCNDVKTAAQAARRRMGA